MGILAFLKTITDIRSAGNLFLEIMAFLKKNKLFPVIFLLPVVFFIIYYLVSLCFLNNMEFFQEKKRNDVLAYVKESLIKCGDKTAISISIISNISKDEKEGIFYVAEVCDNIQKLKGTDCLMDLKNHNSIYKDEYKIEPLTYNYLVDLTKVEHPKHIKLNKDGKQDLTPIQFLPTMRLLIEMTDWAKEGKIKDLWITAVESELLSLPNSETNVLYVFTFKTAIERTSCDSEIQDILIKLKNKMRASKW
jgi:hypothetical protein